MNYSRIFLHRRFYLTESLKRTRWDYFIALRALALLLQLRDRKLPIYCQG